MTEMTHGLAGRKQVGVPIEEWGTFKTGNVRNKKEDVGNPEPLEEFTHYGRRFVGGMVRQAGEGHMAERFECRARILGHYFIGHGNN